MSILENDLVVALFFGYKSKCSKGKANASGRRVLVLKTAQNVSAPISFSPLTCISKARTEREFSKVLIQVFTVTLSFHFGNAVISNRILLKTQA